MISSAWDSSYVSFSAFHYLAYTFMIQYMRISDILFRNIPFYSFFSDSYGFKLRQFVLQQNDVYPNSILIHHNSNCIVVVVAICSIKCNVRYNITYSHHGEGQSKRFRYMLLNWIEAIRVKKRKRFCSFKINQRIFFIPRKICCAK